MKILDYTEKGVDHSRFYLMAIVAGVVAGILLIGGLKLLYFIIKILIKHWIISVISILALIIIRHLIKKRSLKIKQRSSYAGSY